MLLLEFIAYTKVGEELQCKIRKHGNVHDDYVSSYLVLRLQILLLGICKEISPHYVIYFCIKVVCILLCVVIGPR